MPVQVADAPRRSRMPSAGAISRRGELAAALATAVVLAQLIVAQATLLVTVVLAVAGRAARWRPGWLAAPALTGLAWTLSVGVRPALAAFAAGPRVVVAMLTHPGRLAPLREAAETAWHRLPAQLPVALLAGSAQAWLLQRCGWLTTNASTRPWLIAGTVGRWRRAELAAGHTATADGCALGVRSETGRLAGFSWAEAQRGVLVTGAGAGPIVAAALPVVTAALRRRKTVLVVDLTGRHVILDAVGSIADALGIPSVLAGELARDAGQAIRHRTVVLASALPRSGEHLQPSRALHELADVLSRLCELRLRADCLAWIHGVGDTDTASAAELISLGSQAGTSVLLSTASPAAAAQLAGGVSVVVAAGPVEQDLATRLAGYVPAGQVAAGVLTSQPPGSLAVLAPGRPIVRCAAIALRIGHRP
jgi:hypothetical protein